MKNITQHIIVVSLALVLTACGQGMNTSSVGASKGTNNGNNAGDNGGLSVPSTDYETLQKQALQEAADAELAAQQAVQEAEKALNKISLSSSGVSFGSGSMDQQLIVDKLVKKILDKVVVKLGEVPQKLDQIRMKLANEISKLDPSNPLHQAGIAALMVAMSKVDDVENNYSLLLNMVADKVDLVANKLDLLAAAVPFPASILVAFELSSVKVVLKDFQNQLRNL
ncbi:MAG: hypothetical protein KDD34_07515 [Bdellovibrionales bacterium]|nr:hypothetical protein [Bdellovibrionales bacterium]